MTNHSDPIFDEPNPDGMPPRPSSIAPAKIIIAAPDSPQRAAWVHMLTAMGHATAVCEQFDEARRTLSNDAFHVALIDTAFDHDSGMKLARHLDRRRSRTKTVLLTNDTSFSLAVDALRLRTVDVITLPADAESLRYAVECAMHRWRSEDEQIQRVERLRDVCSKLSAAKNESTKHIDVLCQDLATAYEDIADQMSELTTATEFRTLIAQELDLEDLLRTSLEYMLTKTGPTNAAVFLPDGDDMFSLGAYVNYDCPREEAEILLEHLAGSVCPLMAEEQEILRFDDTFDLTEWLESDAIVLNGCDVVAFSCFDGQNCLAVMVFFRDIDTPFDSDLISTIDALRPIFARQVSSVINVHHRAAPQWPAEPAEDGWEIDDEFGFAA